jgi:hypothetical protein
MTDIASSPRNGEPADDQRLCWLRRMTAGRGWPPMFAANRFLMTSEPVDGLRTPSGPRLSTCVFTIVLTSAWPSSSYTVRMSYPSSSR